MLPMYHKESDQPNLFVPKYSPISFDCSIKCHNVLKFTITIDLFKRKILLLRISFSYGRLNIQ